MNLDEIERLEAQATPGPWQASTSEGDVFVNGADMSSFVCHLGTEAPDGMADAAFIAAARNALPALLRVARAALDLVEAEIRYDVAIDAAHSPLVDASPTQMAAVGQGRIDARMALFAAIAFLECEP